MKKFVIGVLCIATAFLAVAIHKNLAFATEETIDKKIVYISTAGELLAYTYDYFAPDNSGYANYDNRKFSEYTFVLTRNIDLDTDTSWHSFVPDWETNGWYARCTHANIEGNGYTISNLWSNSRDESALFFILQDNFIRNLNIKLKYIPIPNPISTDSSLYTYSKGGLATSVGNVVISNVHVKGNLIYASGIGGICTGASFSTIENCSFEGDIVASGAGGLVNSVGSTTITNCFFKGSIYAAGGGGFHGHYSEQALLKTIIFSVKK